MKCAFKILLLASFVIGTVQAELHPSDDRKSKGPDSPKFLDAVGRLTVYNALTKKVNYCGATLVGFTSDRKSRIVVTSDHCIQGNKKSWKTTTKSGKIIDRKIVKVLDSDSLSDYAILLLDDHVEPSDVAPLIIDYEGGDSVDRMIGRGGEAVVAGYSADKELGQGGKVLTYDDSIESIGSCDDEEKCPVGGSTRGATTYSGASGGAAIVTFESPKANVNKGIQHYFVGPIKGGLSDHFVSSNGVRGSDNTIFTFHERFWNPLFDHLVEYNGAVEGIE
ncbi:hypothetical protein A9Q84_01415 [Halobacteriovorax marinus]|uniref:Peptidase S1 domain-containing protein n=1 Tax=Halobacteriovorax marinus TaxID=97084 RepID=A0A1Y5FCG3_9BACT|nr:hypothetical protein A9Q84_01415 [Halobacteriovorax marinus]